MLKIITGTKGSGKSTRLDQYIKNIGKQNFFGFISFCNEERNRYWIKNIETDDCWLLLWESSTPKYSRFDYDENVFKKVNAELKLRVKEELKKTGKRKIGVLDEVGKIEQDGKGLNEGFLALLNYSKKEEVVLVIRENFIKGFDLIEDYQLLN